MIRRQDISVVIPTVGRPILRRCLESIVSGDEVPKEIIVVDQSSSPEIGQLLGECMAHGVEARHLCSTRTGRAAGVNQGLRSVTTRLCAITDDDCTVARDWLENIRRRLVANPGQVVTGRVEAEGDEAIPVVVRSSVPRTYSRPRLKFDALCGGNMGLDMRVVAEVGMLDEDPALRCSEDGEWAYRALRKGIAIEYAPDILVYHFGWRDSAERNDQYRRYAISHGGFYGKYLRRLDYFIALRVVAHYLRALRRLARGIVRGNDEDSRIARAYLRWLGPGILAGLRSRYRTDDTGKSGSP